MNINTTTLAWSTKMISLMDGEELLRQIMNSSLMHNGKMELDMDTPDTFIMMVTALNVNIQMVITQETFDINITNKQIIKYSLILF